MTSIINTLGDVKLVPTPVRYSCWTIRGRVVEVREEPRADLFVGPPRKATVILSNAYGDPFVEIGRLSMVRARAATGDTHWRKMVMTVGVIRPKKRNAVWFDRDLPRDPVLIAWGEHTLDLSGLPLLTGNGVRWRCATFPVVWQEVSRCFHAIAKQ